MTDILKRLREPPFGTETSERNLMSAGADEIERLRALLKRCQFRIYGAGIGTDELFTDLYAVTRKK